MSDRDEARARAENQVTVHERTTSPHVCDPNDVCCIRAVLACDVLGSLKREETLEQALKEEAARSFTAEARLKGLVEKTEAVMRLRADSLTGGRQDWDALRTELDGLKEAK